MGQKWKEWINGSHSRIVPWGSIWGHLKIPSESWWLPWNVRAYFGALWLWLYHHAPVMARVFGRPVSVCGSICKIDLCLDIFGPYNCWENLIISKKLSQIPDSRYFLSSQIPDFLGFNSQIPDLWGLYSLIPDADSPPPLPQHTLSFSCVVEEMKLKRPVHIF